jgi:membrane protease YdiL (CAAX protease family)
VAMPFSILLEEWNAGFSFLANYKMNDERLNKLYEAMLHVASTKELWLNIFFLFLCPAIIEELFFRGFLQQITISWLKNNQAFAIVFIAFIFSAFHGQLEAFLPRFFLGLILGIVYYFTNNLWLSILLHFINNFMAVYTMYLFYAKKTTFNISHLPNMNILLGMASLIATLGFGYYFYINRKPFHIVEVEKETNEKQKTI